MFINFSRQGTATLLTAQIQNPKREQIRDRILQNIPPKERCKKEVIQKSKNKAIKKRQEMGKRIVGQA